MPNSKTSANRGRVMVAKVGLDGHDRGARVLSRMLRDEGFEVVFVGIRHTPQQVARIASEEEIDIVGLSVLSGAHVELSKAVRIELDRLGLKHVPIAVGGLIPREDAAILAEVGVARAFHSGDIALDREVMASNIDELVGKSRAMRGLSSA